MSKGFVELASGLMVPMEKPDPPTAKAHATMDLPSKGTPEIRHKSADQIRDFPPTSDDCEKQTTLFDKDDEVTYADWHPQWGGYCGKSVVLCSRGDVGGCFNVINWHDGEFPRDDEFTETHYCSPLQLVEFGTTVLEKQLNSCVVLGRGAIGGDELRELASKLVALADQMDGMEQLC